jgi:hypothetical protein
MSQTALIKQILDAVDRGVSTKELREDYKKHILSGPQKKIVINTGGEGLKGSYNIFQEMAKRGDDLAKILIEKDNFYVICDVFSSRLKDAYYYDNRDKQWTYLERFDRHYDRENKTLIEILEEKS